MTYVVKNSVSGRFWGLKRSVAEYPDAQKFTKAEYKKAVLLSQELGGNWFVADENDMRDQEELGLED